MKRDPNRDGAVGYGMKSLSLLSVLLGAALASGCVSARMTTNLKPGADPELKSPAGRFYVAGVKYLNTDPQAQQMSGADYERNLIPLVRKECVSRYPALFVDQPGDSIPLGVEVRQTSTLHNGKTVAWMLCTVFVCGMILPCPGQMDEAFVVKAGVWGGRDGMRGAPLENGFQRENYSWVSLFTPLALIRIPGESDFPKVSGTIFGIQSQMRLYYEQIAQQTATALAQLVATKDPEYWATVSASTEALPSTLQPPPTSVPLPGEQPQPF
jgi:hypothetical protein